MSDELERAATLERAARDAWLEEARHLYDEDAAGRPIDNTRKQALAHEWEEARRRLTALGPNRR